MWLAAKICWERLPQKWEKDPQEHWGLIWVQEVQFLLNMWQEVAQEAAAVEVGPLVHMIGWRSAKWSQRVCEVDTSATTVTSLRKEKTSAIYNLEAGSRSWRINLIPFGLNRLCVSYMMGSLRYLVAYPPVPPVLLLEA